VGLIGTLLDWFRTTDGDAEVTDVKVDLGGNDITTAHHYQPSGMDSQPLPDDYILLVPGPEAGTYVVAGYLDPKNAGVSRPGDVRLYVRNGQGDVTGELHLTNDGKAPDWKATAGALIARADRTDAALNALAQVFNGHQHPYTGAGSESTPQVSGTPSSTNPATELTKQKQSTSHAVGADKGWVT
jgi:hypothetical protein